MTKKTYKSGARVKNDQHAPGTCDLRSGKMERVTRTHKTERRGKRIIHKETYHQEGFLDIYVRMVQKIGLHPIIATMDFILLILLLWFRIMVSGKKDIVIEAMFTLTLILFILVNIYAYQKQCIETQTKVKTKNSHEK